MVLGIVLITIGVIGSIATLIYGIKFMKQNNILLKGDYVDVYGSTTTYEDEKVKDNNSSELKSSGLKSSSLSAGLKSLGLKSSKLKSSNLENKSSEPTYDETEILDLANSNDTEILDLGSSQDTEVLDINEINALADKREDVKKDSMDTEVLM